MNSKIFFGMVCLLLLPAGTVWGWGSQCHEIATTGATIQREEGKCALAEGAKADKSGNPYDGLVRCKNDEGKIIEEAVYKKGALVSDWFYDYRDRKRFYHFNKEDQAHGPAKAFNKEGGILCEMNYVNGRVDGIVREYHASGKLKSIGLYKNGSSQFAPSIGFDDKGDVTYLRCPQVSVTPEDKKLCGFDGKPVTVLVHGGFDDTETHVNGRLTERIRLDRKSGIKWRTVYAKPGDAENYLLEEYYPDGKPRRQYTVKGGQKEGKYLEYAENGKLSIEKNYNHGVDMTEMLYYMNGRVKEHSVRQLDGRSCSTKTYWDNGQVQSSRNYALPKETRYADAGMVIIGKAYKYAENGALREELNYSDNGKLDGLQVRIDEKGGRTEFVYQNGVLAAKKVFSSGGTLELAEEYHEDGSRK